MDFFQGLASGLANSRCEKLQAPSYLNLALSIFILLGILLSYLPQHYRIIARATSEGISPWFILLGTTSSTCAFANILVLPASRADVACCKTVSTFECAAGLLGIAQVGIQWSCFTIILLLFLIFFPRGGTLSNLEIEEDEFPQGYTWRNALVVAILCIVHGVAVIITSSALLLAHPDYLGAWANILGISATVLAAVQYLPQIYLTWNLGHIGSLSIPMMLIQTPGSFVWSASLAARLGIEGWSTWGIMLVTGCLQGILLAMGVSFELKARRETTGANDPSGTCIVGYMESPGARAETDDEGGAQVETEATPLLNGSRKVSRNEQ